MVMRRAILSLFLVATWFANVSAGVQKLQYDVILMKNKIGSATVEKHTRNDTTQYFLKSSSTAKVMMMKQSSSISFDVLFKKNQLITSHYKMNKDDENFYTKIFWDKSKYSINANGVQKSSLGPIAMTTIQLYFQEPKNIAQIFVERLGEFIKLTKSAEGVYEYTLPDGVKNIYRYTAGKLMEVELSKTMGSVYMKLVQ